MPRMKDSRLHGLGNSLGVLEFSRLYKMAVLVFLGLSLSGTVALLGSGTVALPAPAESPYKALEVSIDGVPVVRLTDAAHAIEVSILPSLGNIASEMKVHGKNILVFPERTLADFQRNPTQTGIPFIAPWANRLDSEAFWANGKRYLLDPTLRNYRKDGNGLPLHGLLPASTPWRITDMGADKGSAHVTSRFEFWRYPDLMAQWPFAHEYEMTYTLAGGMLEVKTTVLNLSTESMPLVIGYHPYFQIPGIPRDQWVLHLPARKAIVADSRRLPSGELKALDLPNPLPLKSRTLDDGFTDLVRDEKGRARFLIEAEGKQIQILFGPKYPVAIVWEPASPPGQTFNFICVEPMTGITNGINLNHAGKYPDLQTVPAKGTWTESFWISAEGWEAP